MDTSLRARSRTAASRLLVAMIGLICAAQLHAADHDESKNGDLSDSAAAPTTLVLNNTTTLVGGTMGYGNRDYFTFTVPPGKAVSSIKLLHYGSAEEPALAAIQTGPTWSAGNRSSRMLAWQMIGADEVGQNLFGLPARKPLLPATYTVHLLAAGSPSEFSLSIGYQPQLLSRGELKTFVSIGGRPSVAQYLQLKGSSVTGQIKVAAPAGFEISLSNKPGSWKECVILAPPGSTGEVDWVKLFIRANSKSLADTPSRKLEVSTPGGATLTRTVVVRWR